MRTKKFTLPVVALFLVLAVSCKGGEREGWVEYQLYFAVSEATYGDALRPISHWMSAEQEFGPGDLLAALLAGPPEGEDLRSPFPSGLQLRDWQWKEGEEGVVQVNFSEQYIDLADISLTLADYCVTLTLCQLEEVEGVEIASGGRVISYRSHQLLTDQEVIFSGQGGPPSTSGS